MTKPVEITDENFEQAVLKSELPVLLDLWAAWCGPCRMVGPVVEQPAGSRWASWTWTATPRRPVSMACRVSPPCFCSKGDKR